jgi:hypothetical protein
MGRKARLALSDGAIKVSQFFLGVDTAGAFALLLKAVSKPGNQGLVLAEEAEIEVPAPNVKDFAAPVLQGIKKALVRKPCRKIATCTIYGTVGVAPRRTNI